MKIALFALSAAALAGLSACSQTKEASGPKVDPHEVVAAADKTQGDAATAKTPTPAAVPVDTTPVPGAEVSKFTPDQTILFYKLVDSLQSPCGKAQSLRKSLAAESACPRAPFALRYLVALVEEGANEDQARTEYESRYEGTPRQYTFGLQPPFSGVTTAPVKLVEFFDYACPHCAHFAPILEEAVKKFPDKVAVYYKNFPLNHNPDSPMAARAALAANAQQKFTAMHKMLFANAPKHKRADVIGYAKSIGLDVARFEKDLDGFAGRVEADRAEGMAAGVDGTPRLYINGKPYEGPASAKFLALWLEEEIAMLSVAAAAPAAPAGKPAASATP